MLALLHRSVRQCTIRSTFIKVKAVFKFANAVKVLAWHTGTFMLQRSSKGLHVHCIYNEDMGRTQCVQHHAPACMLCLRSITMCKPACKT